jgi:hypothetical protein
MGAGCRPPARRQWELGEAAAAGEIWWGTRTHSSRRRPRKGSRGGAHRGGGVLRSGGIGGDVAGGSVQVRATGFGERMDGGGDGI